MKKLDIGWNCTILAADDSLKAIATFLIDATDEKGEPIRFAIEAAVAPDVVRARDVAKEAARAELEKQGKGLAHAIPARRKGREGTARTARSASGMNVSMPAATAGAARPTSYAAPVREVATGNRYQRSSRPCVEGCPVPDQPEIAPGAIVQPRGTK